MNMNIFIKTFVVSLLINVTPYASNLTIINGPKNSTVCMGTMAEINCGFTGGDPYIAIPNWRITLTSDNGSINTTDITGQSIVKGSINGFSWSVDMTNGENQTPNSKLIIKSVNQSYNQSSYQCIFVLLNRIVESNTGTLTVVDPPSISITVEEVCVTTVTISLTVHSHTACGDVSHTVQLVLSDSTMSPFNVTGTNYKFNGLAGNTEYQIMINCAYKNGSRILNESMRTRQSKPPNPIDAGSIELLTNNIDVKVIWKEPILDNCLMSKIDHYEIKIKSGNDELVSIAVNDSFLMFSNHLEYQPNVSYTISIVVVNRNGMSSPPTSKSFGNVISPNSNKDDNASDSNTAVIITPIVIIITVSIIIIIIGVLLYYWYHRHHQSAVVTFNTEAPKAAEDNRYVESYNNNNDSRSNSAIPANATETVSEPPVHSNNTAEDKSSPPLSSKLNYVELQLDHTNMPKSMPADNTVAYAETKTT